LFTARDFGDLRISSEDSIVAIFGVITAVLLNIFGLLDTPLKALESFETSSNIGTKTEDIHLDNTIDY
jgi:NADH:ubiquinone oxidoreductase subunit 5 (subunit L)/multisubunit Na+/H+ antiporter MnhA subunit